jgi:enoyl-CoA hydratase/carnithine racemase
MQSLDLPMLTIGLVQGAALGGGFEALLSFDYIVAERDATFGLPEILFGLFPGMGAHAILSRKLGAAMADRLIVSNQTYTPRRCTSSAWCTIWRRTAKGSRRARTSSASASGAIRASSTRARR